MPSVWGNDCCLVTWFGQSYPSLTPGPVGEPSLYYIMQCYSIVYRITLTYPISYYIILYHTIFKKLEIYGTPSGSRQRHPNRRRIHILVGGDGQMRSIFGPKSEDGRGFFSIFGPEDIQIL